MCHSHPILPLSVPNGSTSFVPITIRNMMIVDANARIIGVVQPIDTEHTTDAIRKNEMKLFMVIAS